jgi:hypothetical protein
VIIWAFWDALALELQPRHAAPDSLPDAVKLTLDLTFNEREWLVGKWVHLDQLQEQAPPWFLGDTWFYDQETSLLRGSNSR